MLHQSHMINTGTTLFFCRRVNRYLSLLKCHVETFQFANSASPTQHSHFLQNIAQFDTYNAHIGFQLLHAQLTSTKLGHAVLWNNFSRVKFNINDALPSNLKSILVVVHCRSRIGFCFLMRNVLASNIFIRFLYNYDQPFCWTKCI